MIHLAIAFDSNYYNPFCALLASIIFQHPRGNVFIHAIATDVSEKTLSRITDYVHKSGNEIKFYSIDDPRLQGLVTMSTWTSAVYYRLYFPLIIDEGIERLIYLDSDTLVLKNLETLYSLSLNGFPAGAVRDNYVNTQPLIGIVEEGEYFNSGVLLIDMPAWRAQNISEQTIDYLLKYPERIKFVDQCALNAILFHQWEKLDIAFNLLYSFVPQNMSKKEADLFINNKSIIHFTLQRPWLMLSKNPYRYLYSKYLKLSGLQKGPAISDFTLTKIPKWFYFRIIDFYHNHLWLKAAWQFFKAKKGT